MRRPGLRLPRLVLGLFTVALTPAAASAQPSAPDTAADARAAPAGRGPLVTDRPDFTESAASVAPGRFQLETGYTFARRAGARDHSVGEMLVRIGIARDAELRIAPGSYRVVEAPGGTVDGLADPAVGAKVTLLEPGPDAARPLPSIAVLAATSLPAGHEALNPDGPEPEALVALGWELDGRLSVGANVRHGRLLSDGERYGQTTVSTAVGVAASSAVGTYLEFYTLRPSARGSEPADVVNGGLTLLLGADAQLDARLGAGLGAEGPDLILGVGFSARR